MNVFDDLRNGVPYDIRDPEYLRVAHNVHRHNND